MASLEGSLLHFDSLLHLAAQDGDQHALSWILSKARECSPRGQDFLNFIDQQDKDGFTALHQATECKHDELVYKLLCAGADVNLRDKDHRTPLHLAAQAGDCIIMQHLLDFSASSTSQDRKLQTPLHLASIQGHTEAVKVLLYEGPEAKDMEDKESRTPLFYAATNHHKDVAMELVNSNADVEASKYGLPMLHQMAWTGNLEAVKILLQVNASKHALDNVDRIPLYVAAQAGHEAVFRSLLYWKDDTRDAEKKDAVGCKWLTRAVDDGSVEAVNLFLSKEFSSRFAVESARLQSLLYASAKRNKPEIARRISESLPQKVSKDETLVALLHQAVCEGDAVAVGILCDIGANINARDSLGRTALYMAAESRHDAVFVVLQEKKADMGAPDDKGDTLLHRAVREGNALVTVSLIASGAPLNEKNNQGSTALHIAAGSGHKLVELLLGAGAETSVVDNDGQSPLHIATERGGGEGLKIVRMLLGGGANTILEGKDGQTPLHAAAVHNDADILTLLLGIDDVRAAKDKVDAENQTALHVAADHGSIDAVFALISQGLDTQALDKNGQTPLHLAAENGHSEVVNLLLAVDDNRNTKDGQGRTSQYHAIRCTNLQTIDLLLNIGAPEMPIPERKQLCNMEQLCTRTVNQFIKSSLDGFPKKDLTTLIDGEAALGALRCGLHPSLVGELMKLKLYDFLLVCDDTAPMTSKGSRWLLEKALEKMAEVAWAMRKYDNTGIALRFSSYEELDGFDNITSVEDLWEKAYKAFESPSEGASFGNELMNQLVRPLVLEKLQEETFHNPLIIFMITDGESMDEDTQALRETIYQCQNALQEKRFGHASAVFILVRMGDSDKANEMVKDIESDPRIANSVYCPEEKLDDLMCEISNQSQTDGPTTKLFQLLRAALDKAGTPRPVEEPVEVNGDAE